MLYPSAPHLFAKINLGIITSAFLLSTENAPYLNYMDKLFTHDLDIDGKRYKEIFGEDPPVNTEPKNAIDQKLIDISNRLDELFCQPEKLRIIYEDKSANYREKFTKEFLENPHKYQYPLEVLNDKDLGVFSKFSWLRLLLLGFSKNYPNIVPNPHSIYNPLLDEYENLHASFVKTGTIYKNLYLEGFKMHSLWVQEVS